MSPSLTGYVIMGKVPNISEIPFLHQKQFKRAHIKYQGSIGVEPEHGEASTEVLSRGCLNPSLVKPVHYEHLHISA